MKKSRNVIYIFIFSIVITMSGISSMHTKAAAVSGDTLVNFALNNCIGKPYVSGGRSPSGFDCSGLVWYVCNHFGINIGSGNQNSVSGAQQTAKVVYRKFFNQIGILPLVSGNSVS